MMDAWGRGCGRDVQLPVPGHPEMEALRSGVFWALGLFLELFAIFSCLSTGGKMNSNSRSGACTFETRLKSALRILVFWSSISARSSQAPAPSCELGD